MFANSVSLGKDVKDLVNTGDAPEFNARKVEGLRAFFSQGDERTQYYRTNAKLKKYEKDAEQLSHWLREYKKDMEENVAHRLKYEELTKGSGYARLELIKEANRSSKEDGKVGLDDEYKAAMQLSGDERKAALRVYNEKVAELVEQLEAIEE